MRIKKVGNKAKITYGDGTSETILASQIERLKRRGILRMEDPWSLAKSSAFDDEYKSLIVSMANMLLSVASKVDSIKSVLIKTKEDEPTKKMTKSCLSCRFYKETTGELTFCCLNEMVNRCFVHSIYMYIESTKQIEFSCNFYEYNLGGL